MTMRVMFRVAGVALIAACGLVQAGAQGKKVALPLHTSGRQIVDATGRPVQMLSVNWYGIDQKDFVVGGLDRAPLGTIVDEIAAMGFNSVRLPWANETLEHDPLVPDYALAANPKLKGEHAMELMDNVVKALARKHIMVILDNHMSNADWCCSETDKNGLWYNDEYPEAKWIADWKTMARRYAGEEWVVGADLRNELRSGGKWGGDDPKLDWHAGAERGGNAVLEANPKLLIFVEGPGYSTNFVGVDKLPAVLKVADRLVYSPHAYGIGNKDTSYAEMAASLDKRWGFLLTGESQVPIWIGEFGACQTLECGNGGQWFKWWIAYCKEHHVANLSYWAVNGTQSTGRSRKYGAVEDYGLLDPTYQHVAAGRLIELIHSVQPDAARQ